MKNSVMGCVVKEEAPQHSNYRLSRKPDKDSAKLH